MTTRKLLQEGGITLKGAKTDGLEIAGDDMIFYTANGEIDEKTNSLSIEPKEVNEPKYIRYAFGNGVGGNLSDETGLLIVPYSTD